MTQHTEELAFERAVTTAFPGTRPATREEIAGQIRSADQQIANGQYWQVLDLDNPLTPEEILANLNRLAERPELFVSELRTTLEIHLGHAARN